MTESIYPWDLLEERGGNLAEDPGDDEGEGEEAAVGQPGGALGDTRHRRRAEPAGAARAARHQARHLSLN